MKIASDDELDRLDKYKDVTLIKAISECNSYLQTSSFITMMDFNQKKFQSITRDTSALFHVMEYVNEESISREALIEKIYELACYCKEHDIDAKSEEGKSIYFAMNLLIDILKSNTLFEIYICSKDFKAKLVDINNEQQIEVYKDETLFLTNHWIKEDKSALDIFFNVDQGVWIYIENNINQNLIRMKENNEIEDKGEDLK